MKFVIEHISSASGRLGHLLNTRTGKAFKTPLLIQTTKSGSIPHLCREVFDYITEDVQVLQMSLATMHHMADALKVYPDHVSAYVAFRDFPVVLTIRDPCEVTPSGSNDKNMVPLFTRRGKESLSPNRFMELVEIFSPDIYQGLCDADTNAESSNKRIQKSVDRSSEFFDYCYEEHKKSEKISKLAFFAPIVGGYNKFARSKSIQHVANKASSADISGYVFEGFHNNGLTATEVNLESLFDIVQHCMNELDSDKPKMMMGAYSPLATLELIRLGIDIFDTSYAYVATANFKALSFNFNLNIADDARQPFIDLTEDRFSQDFSPFLEDCSCLACRKHTKAYVHHLYNTHEMLGPILLMIHNIHHYMCFFNAAREAISANNLADLIKLVKFQSTETAVDYTIKQISKKIAKSDAGKALFCSKE